MRDSAGMRRIGSVDLLTKPRLDGTWQVLSLIFLTGWLYYPVITNLVRQWRSDDNFSYGFLVPLFSLFILWRQRFDFEALRPNPSSWGFLLVLLSLALLVTGMLGAELFLSRISLPILLAGFVVFFLGWDYLRTGLFAWLFLFLMIPLPAILMNQVTLPLQTLAAKVAAGTLPLFGVPVFRAGNIIELPAMPLEVAEACSGIRSLLMLITLAIVYGYLVDASKWMRIVLAVAAVPIAIVANSLRIVGTGLLVQYWDPLKAKGFFHIFSGWLIFVISLLLLVSLHRLLAWFQTAKNWGRAVQ